YAYLLELEGIGEDHDLLFLDREGSMARARAEAEQSFMRKSRNVVAPCPLSQLWVLSGRHVPKAKERRVDQLAANRWGCDCGVFARLVGVRHSIHFGIPYIWVLTLVLAVVGLALLAYGYVVSFRFDPNTGDPEPKKALGRRTVYDGALSNAKMISLLSTEDA